ncbi:DUF6114 domain-containing protein [Actinokineospora sp. HUAS TT18]|uniref:DUF6114 domain-containing protein n=1 Tax=Actinokineospora sp. HUAS TT18 TaxID=3447451 RepID=UPI003F527038
MLTRPEAGKHRRDTAARLARVRFRERLAAEQAAAEGRIAADPTRGGMDSPAPAATRPASDAEGLNPFAGDDAVASPMSDAAGRGRFAGDRADSPADFSDSGRFVGGLPVPAADADSVDGADSPGDEPDFVAETPSTRHRVVSLLIAAWRWFRDFRRTRPFWGGLWMMLGGWTIMSLTFAPVVVMLSAGASGVAGYVTGGGLIVLGLIAWFAPTQRLVAGVMGGILAVAAFVASNLGGFLLGTLLGILGSAMVFGWGPKKQRKRAES